ncbi:twin-arginine translocase TatA/TatE family subunit [Opitutae bacterium]|nr:twin-arginine translocase TatA/TatE family subunit [Opitutae bacterium]
MSYLHTAFLSNLSGWELILIFAVILLFFGAKRLPELSESLGKSLKRFKKATSEIEEEVHSALDTVNSEEEAPTIKNNKESNACSIDDNKSDSTNA